MGIELILSIVFIIGYLFIIFEHNLGFDKAATALLTGVGLWTIYILMAPDAHEVQEQLSHHIPGIAGIIFFLLGAMTIVELVDLHHGFDIIANIIKATNKVKLLWIIGFITFFLSAALDNLTTAIVMISLLRKLISEKQDRMLFAGIVIIAANAGGAWSPIGDVTTTMLWIGGQISALSIMKGIFLPSTICLLVPLAITSFSLKGSFGKVIVEEKKHTIESWKSKLVLILGLGGLIFIPIFKTLTHLEPYMGMFFSLSLIWVVTDIIHRNKDEEEKRSFSVYKALTKIDVPSTLFFFGILAAIGCLESVGILDDLAQKMSTAIGNQDLIVYVIGLLSAVVDNVPLVAATQGMYTLSDFPMDHEMWHFIAYCAGTGGSILIIGSAAGVAVMGLEKIDFVWYVKRIGWLAFLGYTAGALVHVGEAMLGSG